MYNFAANVNVFASNLRKIRGYFGCFSHSWKCNDFAAKCNEIAANNLVAKMLPVEFLIEIPVVLRIVEVSLGILVNEFSLGCTECQPIFDALSQ